MINMRCKNCNETMLAFYAKNGFVLFVCPKAQLQIVKRNHSQLRDGVVFCGVDIVKTDKMLKDSLILELAQVSKKITRMQKRLIA